MADNILIEFMLDDANFRADLQKSTGEVDKLQGKVKDTKAPVGDLKTGFGDTATAIAGAAVKATAFAAAAAAASAAFVFVKGIESAAATQTALQKAADAMGRFGDFSRGALGDISAFADGLQKTKGVADETTLSAFALSKSFGLTNEQAKLVVSTAADMSAALGTDLNENVKQLSETYEGHIGKLGKVIVGVEGAATANAHLGAVVELAAKQFNGAASGALKGYNGAILETKLSFEDFTKSIGRLIVDNPAVESTIRALSGAFDAISSAVDKNAGSLRTFIAEGIIQLLKSVKEVIAVFKIFQDLFQDEAVNPFDSYDKSIQSMKEGLESARTVAIGFASTMLSALQGYIQIKLAVAENSAIVSNFFPKEIADFKDQIKQLTDAQQALANRTVDVATAQGTSKASDLGAEFQPGKAQDDKSSPLLAGLDKLIATIEGQIKTGAVAAGTSAAISPVIQVVGQKTQQDIDSLDDSFGAFIDRVGDSLSSLDKLSQSASAAGDALSGGGFGAALLHGITQGGIQGANTTVSESAGALASIAGAGGPLAGGIASLFQTLGEDPETFKKMIEGFVKGIPIIIKNIVTNIPVLIKALADAIPDVVVALANGAPQIVLAIGKALLNPQLYIGVASGILQALAGGVTFQANKLGEAGDKFKSAGSGVAEQFHVLTDGIKGIPNEMLTALRGGIPGIFNEFKKVFFDQVAKQLAIFDKIKEAASAFTNAIGEAAQKFIDGVANAINAFIDGVKQAASKATGGGGGGGGFITQSYHTVLGHATGGTVPEGFPNDNYPAFLTSGETIIPKDDVQRLRTLVDRGGSGGSNGDNSTQTLLLAQLLDLMKKPQTVTSTATVDGRAFADVILTLSRSNQRFA